MAIYVEISRVTDRPESLFKSLAMRKRSVPRRKKSVPRSGLKKEYLPIDGTERVDHRYYIMWTAEWLSVPTYHLKHVPL